MWQGFGDEYTPCAANWTYAGLWFSYCTNYGYVSSLLALFHPSILSLSALWCATSVDANLSMTSWGVCACGRPYLLTDLIQTVQNPRFPSIMSKASGQN